MSALEASLAALGELPKFGSGVGLHRVEALSAEIRQGAWFAALDPLRITGSNGKGSTTAMVAAILGELGIHHGRYTSPHLLSFHERFAVDGSAITDADLAAAIEWALARRRGYEAAWPGDRVGGFELFTALALHHFERRQVETVVAEAGIGGRFDPVRCLGGTVVGLTSLDLEHREILGGTLEQIAYDKADLCGDGGVLVLGPVGAEIQRRLAAYCRLRGIRLLAVEERLEVFAAAAGDTRGTTVDLALDGRRFDGLEIALPGRHQISNAAVAILLVGEWLARHRPALAPEDFTAAVRRGLAAVRWPGQLQQVASAPDIFVDFAHTPAAVEALAATVRERLAGRRILLLTGVSRDKEIAGIVTRLLPLAERVVATRAHHKGAPAESVAEVVRRVRPDLPVEVVESVEAAVALAAAVARAEGMTVLVAGGLFLAVEAAQALHGADPRALWFY